MIKRELKIPFPYRRGIRVVGIRIMFSVAGSCCHYLIIVSLDFGYALSYIQYITGSTCLCVNHLIAEAPAISVVDARSFRMHYKMNNHYQYTHEMVLFSLTYLRGIASTGITPPRNCLCRLTWFQRGQYISFGDIRDYAKSNSYSFGDPSIYLLGEVFGCDFVRQNLLHHFRFWRDEGTRQLIFLCILDGDDTGIRYLRMG